LNWGFLETLVRFRSDWRIKDSALDAELFTDKVLGKVQGDLLIRSGVWAHVLSVN
jgi:hypothetical protein